jgi:hypothetical protein
MSNDTAGTSTFTRWYDKNRDEYNRKRRERYKNDPEYRKAQLEAVQEKRRNAGATAKPARPANTFTTSEVAAKVGKTVESLKWHGTKGNIPWPEIGEYHARLFTASDVAKITAFYKEHDSGH